jgi:hypothetical protein
MRSYLDAYARASWRAGSNLVLPRDPWASSAYNTNLLERGETLRLVESVPPSAAAVRSESLSHAVVFRLLYACRH